jgi:hypothetical protein
MRARIRDLLDTRHYGRDGYVEYSDVRAYSEQVGEAVAAISSLTAAGHADDAVEVAREMIAALAKAYENVDDSSGYLGGVADDLGEVHLQACRIARPDPEKTAQWLVGHMLGETSYLPDICADDYHSVLGEAGVAKLRLLVTEALRRKPSGWAEKHLMQSLVRAEGDVDAIIAVYAADLWMAPPSRSRRMILVSVASGWGSARSGAAWSRDLCGRWVLKWCSYSART